MKDLLRPHPFPSLASPDCSGFHIPRYRMDLPLLEKKILFFLVTRREKFSSNRGFSPRVVRYKCHSGKKLPSKFILQNKITDLAERLGISRFQFKRKLIKLQELGILKFNTVRGHYTNIAVHLTKGWMWITREQYENHDYLLIDLQNFVKWDEDDSELEWNQLNLQHFLSRTVEREILSRLERLKMEGKITINGDIITILGLNKAQFLNSFTKRGKDQFQRTKMTYSGAMIYRRKNIEICNAQDGIKSAHTKYPLYIEKKTKKIKRDFSMQNKNSRTLLSIQESLLNQGFKFYRFDKRIDLSKLQEIYRELKRIRIPFWLSDVRYLIRLAEYKTLQCDSIKSEDLQKDLLSISRFEVIKAGDGMKSLRMGVHSGHLKFISPTRRKPSICQKHGNFFGKRCSSCVKRKKELGDEFGRMSVQAYCYEITHRVEKYGYFRKSKKTIFQAEVSNSCLHIEGAQKLCDLLSEGSFRNYLSVQQRDVSNSTLFQRRRTYKPDIEERSSSANLKKNKTTRSKELPTDDLLVNVRREFSRLYGKERERSWLSGVVYSHIEQNETLVLKASRPFTAKYLEDHFESKIISIWNKLYGAKLRLLRCRYDQRIL